MSSEICVKEILQDVKAVGKLSFSLSEKVLLGNEDDYVLGLSGADDTLYVALSDRTVRVQKLLNSTIKSVHTFNAHKDTITQIQQCPENSRIIYTSSKDGSVRAWDTRAANDSKPVQTFLASSDEDIKPVNCFDIEPKGSLICAGTDQLKQEAALIFWDKRNSKIFDSFLDSHRDDITDVCYHPTQKGLMISGSVDGLINVFDVSQSGEDDAILNTVNTESSVAKLDWTSNQNLTCITHTEEIQIWDSNDVNLVQSYTRENLKSIINSDVDYLVDVLHFPKNNELMLMSGTSKGHAYIWSLEEDQPSLWTALVGGHTDVVRCKTLIGGDKLVTGGEDGIICLWQEVILDSGKESSALKQKLGRHHKKPY